MCAGAIVQARIPTLVYGAADPKAGAVASLYRMLDDTRLNHRCQTVANVRRCQSIKGYGTIAADIAAEQAKVQDQDFLMLLKYYPILSLGFGWRF